MALLCSALWTSSTSAQSNYRLLPDSTVRDIHYNDLKRWASFRLASDEMRRSMAREVGHYALVVNELKGEVTSLRGALSAMTATADALKDANYQLQLDIKLLEKKLGKQVVWATIGKIVVVTVGVVVATVLYLEFAPG